MSDLGAQPGWYPYGAGTLRYWDGSAWTYNVAPDPGAAVADAPEGPDPAAAGTRSSDPGTSRPVWPARLGWGGLAVVAALGALGSGVEGLVAATGLFGFVVALIGLFRGHVAWARLTRRWHAGTALAGSLALLAMAGGTPSPPPALMTLTSESAVPSPHPSENTAPANAAAAEASPSADPAGTESALAAVATLTVKGRSPMTGYSRDAFGSTWSDTDGNGCDTRSDILRRDLTDPAPDEGCRPLAGTLDPDPYTGQVVDYASETSSLDVDHVVALADAWQKGASQWDDGKRLAFANDPLNLLLVGTEANRSKGAGDAATWLPANLAYRCAYVARQVSVKVKYDVWVTQAEKDAMTRVLSTCPEVPVLDAGPLPTSAPVPTGTPAASTPTASSPAASSPARRASTAPVAPTKAAPRRTTPARPAAPRTSVYYRNCAAARAAGAAPIYRGEPGYARHLDRDNDGIACER